MGEEISAGKFDASAHENFRSRLETETGLLKEWLATERLKDQRAIGGFEQEAWLVGKDFSPAPVNEKFIEASHSALVSAELARFNIELNVDPLTLNGDALDGFQRELQSVWDDATRTAEAINTRLIMIGILPTLESADLVISNMSTLNRYKALNEQVMIARRGLPMQIDINGHEHLHSKHYDVMLESAATSFQVHRQIPADTAPRYINAAIIVSALTVAAGANSPYLFGKQLWEETRIPLFEQAVEVGGLGNADHGPIRRVTFGSGYLKQNVFEYFFENLEHYPVLLPAVLDADLQTLPYLRMHNGTIWRWNRPLIGFDNHGAPHVRVEHRVISAGPTITDEIANAAFFYGLQEWMATLEDPIEHEIEHAQAKSNFYEGARLGIDASIVWRNQQKYPIGKLILDELLENSRQGLLQLELNPVDIDYYLDIIGARIRTRQTGAQWQKGFIRKHGPDMAAMLNAYYENQQHGRPVHEWPL